MQVGSKPKLWPADLLGLCAPSDCPAPPLRPALILGPLPWRDTRCSMLSTWNKHPDLGCEGDMNPPERMAAEHAFASAQIHPQAPGRAHCSRRASTAATCRRTSGQRATAVSPGAAGRWHARLTAVYRTDAVQVLFSCKSRDSRYSRHARVQQRCTHSTTSCNLRRKCLQGLCHCWACS